MEGIGYSEMFAPVVKFTCVRMLLSIAAVRDLHLHQMYSFTSSFKGDLNEQVFMVQALGYEQGD